MFAIVLGHPVLVGPGHVFSLLIIGGLGFALGCMWSIIRIHRHVRDGFYYLDLLSRQRGVNGPDLHTAFAWPPKDHRVPALQRLRHRDRAQHGPSST